MCDFKQKEFETSVERIGDDYVDGVVNGFSHAQVVKLPCGESVTYNRGKERALKFSDQAPAINWGKEKCKKCPENGL